MTVKGVTFMGPHSEWVVSGCDSGLLWVFDKATGDVVMRRRGDARGAINCLSPHPDGSNPTLVTSGLQHDAKVGWWEGGGGEGGGGIGRRNHCPTTAPPKCGAFVVRRVSG